MEEMVEKALKDLNLGENLSNTKTSVYNFKRKIEELKLLKNDNHNYIYEYFLELRTKIYIERELFKEVIDAHYLDLIDQVDMIEAEYKGKSYGLQLDQFEASIKEFETNVGKLNADLSKLKYNINGRGITVQSSQEISKVETVISELQNELLLNKKYKLESNITSLKNEMKSVKLITVNKIYIYIYILIL